MKNMKFARKNNNKKLVFIIILIIMIAAVVGLVIFMGNGWAEEPTPTEDSVPTMTDSQATEESTLPEEDTPQEDTPKDMMVTTPYCNLYYPAEWKDSVRTEAESTAIGYIVSFYGTAADREVKLFTVFFAESSENSFPIGVITDDGMMMDVSVELSDFAPDSSWETADADAICAMQEGVNHLISKLEENPAFTAAYPSSGSDTSEETNAAAQDLVVTTPYCDLYYPAQWKDALRCESTETDIGYIVEFYGTVNGKEAELFTIYFAEMSEDSLPVGVYSADGVAMDVSISMPGLPENSGWTEAEVDHFCALQEKVNYLLEKLEEDTAFTPVEE